VYEEYDVKKNDKNETAGRNSFDNKIQLIDYKKLHLMAKVANSIRE
jgi:hypothetical protein